MLLNFLALASGGLSVRQTLSDIPRDGAAMFIYVMTAISLWLVWQGSRTGDRRRRMPASPAHSPEPATQSADASTASAPQGSKEPEHGARAR